jgi:hypothetical protein
MGHLARTLLVAFAATLIVVAVARADDPLSKGSEVVQRDAAAACRYATGPCQPEASQEAVAAFERSWEHSALLFQHQLAGDVGFVNAPWVGTHNSFNSIAQLGPSLSDADSNQQLTMLDQLRLGVRSLETDIHMWLGRPTLCHGQGADRAHAGCSVEGEAEPILKDIAAWLRQPENRDEVILLYPEDHLQDDAGYEAGAAVLDRAFGKLLYRPSKTKTCTQLPGTLTRDDVLASGAQVVAVSDCRAGSTWNNMVFAWDSHVEERPHDFASKPCGPDYDRATYDTTLVRYYEDSTWLTVAGSYADQSTQDDGIDAKTAGAMTRCGVDLIGFDQLLPGDGRLAATIWSWAPNQPSAAGTCAVQRGSDGRWEARACSGRLRAACRDGAGWLVTKQAVKAADAAKACAKAGGVPAAPRTGRENTLLASAAGGRTVWLGLRRGSSGWQPLDAR